MKLHLWTTVQIAKALDLMDKFNHLLWNVFKDLVGFE